MVVEHAAPKADASVLFYMVMLGAGAIGSATGFDPAGCWFEPNALCQNIIDNMGCWYSWEHTSFASLSRRFDPGTVHKFYG